MMERITWIDALKGFAIFTVVLGHCATDSISSKNFLDYMDSIVIIKDIIYSFHMPLFFVVSGFVYCLSKSWRRYKSKVVDFSLLYIIWSVLTWIIKFFLGGKVNNPVGLWDLVGILYKPLLQYWYLYVLIVFYIVFSASKLHRFSMSTVLASLALSIGVSYFPLHMGILDKILYHAFYFALGGYFYEYKKYENISMSYVLSAVGVCLIVSLSYFNIIHVHIDSMNPITKIIIACAATILSFYAFTNCKNIAENQFLKLAGINTLAIYVAHLFITGGLRVFFGIMKFSNVYIYFIVGTILGIVIPIAFCNLCKKNDVLGFMLYPLKSLGKLGVIKA